LRADAAACLLAVNAQRNVLASTPPSQIAIIFEFTGALVLGRVSQETISGGIADIGAFTTDPVRTHTRACLLARWVARDAGAPRPQKAHSCLRHAAACASAHALTPPRLASLPPPSSVLRRSSSRTA
jgi:hypothetical protein